MKAAIYRGVKNIQLEEIDKPVLEKDSDAIVRIVRACVCGSDLWFYRGDDDKEIGSQCGHEGIGVVEEVGDAVSDFAPGDFVIIPFGLGCGKCANCRTGHQTNCTTLKFYGTGQSEYARIENANGSLFKIPAGNYNESQLKSILTVSDVMGTGYHAAIMAQVKRGDTVAVVGDGAVGLCAVIAAKMLGAKRIILMSRHEDRSQLGKEFGATDIVPERGEEGEAKVRALTEDGVGVDAVLECVGSNASMQTAFRIARAGAIVGTVGVPHEIEVPFQQIFFSTVGVHGGPAPTRAYAPLLLNAVLKGEINPGKAFTFETNLDNISEAYAKMDKREAIKSYLKVSPL